jgi:hypothetical protein
MTREHWRTKLRQQQNAVGESPLYGHARRHAGRKRRVSPSPRLHRGPQKQGIFAETAAATARVSTRGHKNRDFSYRRQRRQRASPLGATKAGTFHSDGRGDGARLHRGQEKQGLFTQTATATARVSTGGNKSRDFSLRRPRRRRTPPPIVCRRVAKPQSIIHASPTPVRLPSTSCRMLRASLSSAN